VSLSPPQHSAFEPERGNTLLEVRDLRVSFLDRQPSPPAVESATFSVRRGETVGLVGESGAGKTVTVRAIMGLLSPSAVVSGSVQFEGRELLGLAERDMRPYRGSEIAMVFQDATRALNPTMRIGRQITEGLRTHRSLGRKAARARAVELLRRVGLRDPETRLRELPHRLPPLSRQRVAIAIAISCEPKLLIADEPTASLDAPSGGEIAGLLRDLQTEFGMAMILIGHELGRSLVAPEDRVVVMCGGQIVERASGETLRGHSRVPYTRSLLDSSSLLVRSVEERGGDRVSMLRQTGPMGFRLSGASGPRPGARPPGFRARTPTVSAERRGCAFAPRCAFGQPHCREAAPPLKEYEYGHDWACWFPLPDPASSPAEPGS